MQSIDLFANFHLVLHQLMYKSGVSMYFFKNWSSVGPILIVVLLQSFQLHAKKKSISPRKKKIVIMTSKGGYGHIAASDTLESLLKSDYTIQTVKPLEEILHSVDFIKKISGNTIDCEQFYNLVLQKGWINLFNFGCRYIWPHLISLNNNKMEKLLTNYFEQAKPDLVISVMPIINLPASNAAQKCKIPYLMITLDYDLTMWKLGMRRAKHENIVITAADRSTQEIFLTKGLPSTVKHIYPFGVPIRKTFFEKRNLIKIKKEWDIPADKPVAMLLMGGAGSSQTYRYFKMLARFPKPIHLLVCMGRNTKIQKKLTRVRCNEWVSYSCIPFTQKIPDLMAVSDLLITKPGPGTVTEAMLMKVPVLLDRTVKSVFWEGKVFDLVNRHGIGKEVRRLSRINDLVHEMLFDTKQRIGIKQAFSKIPTYRFDYKIKKLVHQLCNQNKTTVMQ